MSRSSAPVLPSPPPLLLLLLLLLLLIDATSAGETGAHEIGCSLRSCAALDAAALLQEFATGLPAWNHTDRRPRELSANESLLQLPFGALDSDWTRLLLLQDRQPEGTVLRDNLLRLSRIVLAAYFDAQDAQFGRNVSATISADVNSTTTTTTTTSTAVAAPKSEDQQAGNVTVGSTAQKGSARINASSIGAYNNEDESADVGAENFAGNAGEGSTPTSYYADSTLANFNQAFSTPRRSAAADNEASGSKSNETWPADNEDESTTESWLESFSASSPTDSDPDGFAQSESSSESSRANEAIHPRSREDFLVSRYASKESRQRDGDDDFVARFFAEEHEQPVHDSMEDLLALMELEEAEANATSPSQPLALGDLDSLEFNATKSLEALLESMEAANATAVAPELDFSDSSTASTVGSAESAELLELLDGISAESTTPPPTTTTTATATQLFLVLSGKRSSEPSNSAAGDATPLLVPSSTSPATTSKTLLAQNRTTSRSHDVSRREAPETNDSTSSQEDESRRRRQRHQSRKILMVFRHGIEKFEPAAAAAAAAEEKLSAPSTKVASVEETAFNPAPLRNRLNREPAIAAMNKLKRLHSGGGGGSGTELLDIERQYRTFPAEPGQRQFVEKRPDEEEGATGRWAPPQ